MTICGKDLKIQGRVIRIARLEADGYLFLDDPETALSELRRHRWGIDLFTFMQNLPRTTPEYVSDGMGQSGRPSNLELRRLVDEAN